MTDNPNKETNSARAEYIEKMEEKKREASLVRKIVLWLCIGLIIVIAAGGFGAYRYVMGTIEPQDEEEDAREVEVEIPAGSNVDTIADILEESGAIESAMIFQNYIRFQGEDGFQAGDYVLHTAMHADEIIAELQEGTVAEEYETTFIIPEGFWLEETFERIDSETNLEEEQLHETAEDEEFLETLIDRYDYITEDILQDDLRHPLEGYLFPARYDFVEEEVSAAEVIDAMAERMASTLDEVNAAAGEDEQFESYHNLLAAASIIEGEAIDDEERGEISGVIDNRLAIDMSLDMDPTVVYAHGERQERTLYEDLEIESPYNTYRNRGLPAGPINNPGEQSISAAMNPEEHSYLYFFHSPEGETYFSESLSEHQTIVNDYQADDVDHAEDVDEGEEEELE
ncbi:endolytic transglycosylase MltG [Salisediminibacterium halotolerans]|uniref:endolytic transglycosylase MltG n=1 Tax=Salisediminibacterium halotolerans TaxID=517425 RepID=UPI000F1F625D|nr:endolytic transglycosylase MltG [Salisediminibacterium halotolerans]RLJ78358.1 UPF0755 protein [Actinophytocola xinjiangensis]RPE88300.1 UPF0755 protein [Salisediminibacterium halotolerans]TWG37334.1 UPF0755 protein [Salisediminibacterium halotolerans]GEL06799.1 hypothetical protein SHA02_02150 [Salisediminibacterium halotolerans]